MNNQAVEEWAEVFEVENFLSKERVDEAFDFLHEELEKLFEVEDFKVELGEVPKAFGRLKVEATSALSFKIELLSDKMMFYFTPHPKIEMSRADLARIALHFESILRDFVETGGKPTLYLFFASGQPLRALRRLAKVEKFLSLIILGNMFYFFVFIFVLGFLMFSFLYYLTPVALVFIQLVIMFFANKLVLSRSDFTISRENRFVYIANVRLRKSEIEKLAPFPMFKLAEVKDEVYSETLAKNLDVTNTSVASALKRRGLSIDEGDVEVKKFDLYGIVEEVAKRFNVKVPSIGVLNVVQPNAMATGISPSRAALLITSGLLSRLSDVEVKAIIAHELSHVKSRDVLKLFIMFSSIFLFRAYILWPKLALLTDFAFLVVSMTFLFFIAKFIEARADLDAAYAIGDPKVLARSLKKITPTFVLKIQEARGIPVSEWLRWDTHPPISFRIRRLEKLETARKRGTFLKSIVDCLTGFISSLFKTL